MIDIQWKGKIGYGDIVSPICYAHNLSYKLNTRVDLTFRWSTGPQHKIDARDPETLWERASFLSTICEKDRTDVNIIHRFDNPLDINHTNYDWDIVGKDPYHNYWVPRGQKQHRPRGLIVVNTTEGNSVSLKDYGKEWKDPIANDWLYLTVCLKQRGYEVVTVDYRTPVRRLWDLLQYAQGFIGYHGTAAWVARLAHTPSVIFSRGGKLTSNAFFYSCVCTGPEHVDKTVENIDELFAKSQQAIDVSRDFYFRKYNIPIPSLRSLRHEKD